MKEITDFRFKHQALVEDYHELQKETEYTMRRLEMMKQKRSGLDAQVRFLRRRYKHLKQDQTLETSPNSTPLHDLNDNTLVSNKVSGFDLNQLSREEEETEANGEATMKTMLGGNGLDCEMKLPICRDVEKEMNRAVKRKVSWQDPVALRV